MGLQEEYTFQDFKNQTNRSSPFLLDCFSILCLDSQGRHTNPIPNVGKKKRSNNTGVSRISHTPPLFHRRNLQGHEENAQEKGRLDPFFISQNLCYNILNDYLAKLREQSGG